MAARPAVAMTRARSRGFQRMVLDHFDGNQEVIWEAGRAHQVGQGGHHLVAEPEYRGMSDVSQTSTSLELCQDSNGRYGHSC